MNKDIIYNLLIKELCEDEILIDEPMSKHTTFKIGGLTDFLIVPNSIDSLINSIKIIKNNDIPFYIIGNGSNLLVSNKGFKGIIIKISSNFNKVSIINESVTAGAGVLLSKLSKEIYNAGLKGFEFASGIPGTLGGAIYMNAGAYGGEIKDVLVEVEVIDNNGDLHIFTKNQLDLGYRYSILQKNMYTIIRAKLILEKGNKEEIKKYIEELNSKRRNKQPLDMASAGSTFKRPEGYYAGKLIMDSGLRGYSIGGAQVSEKHCGFIVNKGNATYNDVIELINFVRKTVKQKYGVDLQPEVRIIGE